MKRNPDTWSLQTLTSEGEPDRREVGFGILTFILGNLKWSGERHRKNRKKKKKVRLFCWEKQEHSSRTNSPRPSPLPLSFFGKKIAERAFTSDFAGCLKLRGGKKEQGNERKQLYLKQWEVFGAVLNRVVALLGYEEGWWWVECPGNRPVLSGEPERHQ